MTVKLSGACELLGMLLLSGGLVLNPLNVLGRHLRGCLQVCL